MELVVAMTIMAVLATVGFQFIRNHANQARDIKARDIVRTVASGIDQYYLRHGRYPDFGNFSSMVDPNSPLVKENFIPTNVPDKDPWGQPYEGVCNNTLKEGYLLKCQGDPKGEYGPFTAQPGKIPEGPNEGGTPAPGTGTPTSTGEPTK